MCFPQPALGENWSELGDVTTGTTDRFCHRRSAGLWIQMALAMWGTS